MASTTPKERLVRDGSQQPVEVSAVPPALVGVQTYVGVEYREVGVAYSSSDSG
ncbi:hypothetical protein BX281_2889 [Streptomyces sp. Ag82_O1-15]|jgi:hypothetical protein|uniref:hypothetical protein n=1 Tax=Streptomyces sp. Ag82_O1-15 TaxID=1938855 RepID=UPI000BD3293E|nr:hypothetical protein [Streptomyces sp. Ag82_O1-15]PBC94961.1 hypothetical protein BX281_2889 [Streptomyces sp. Ag82_O1-15]